MGAFHLFFGLFAILMLSIKLDVVLCAAIFLYPDIVLMSPSTYGLLLRKSSGLFVSF